MFHDEKSREGGGREERETRSDWMRGHIYSLWFLLYINRNKFRTCRVKLMEGSLCMDYCTTHKERGKQERMKGGNHIWSRWFPCASFMVPGARPTLPFEAGIMFRGKKEVSQEKKGHSWGRIALPEVGGGISSLFWVKNSWLWYTQWPKQITWHFKFYDLHELLQGMQLFSWVVLEEGSPPTRLPRWVLQQVVKWGVGIETKTKDPF